tara:strand:+ start:1987 stop:2757 length:771 start_codon:yes stop_codon:yes gene_type:complete
MDPENNNEGQPADTSVDVSTAPEDNSSEGETNTTTPETLLAGKYKSVEDLEKGYRESTKYSRELNDKVKTLEGAVPTAPEEYEFNFKEIEGLEDVEIKADDPDMKAMLPVFKELNLTNDQANRLVQAHLQSMASLSETPEQIKEGLGSEADTIVTKLQDFTNGLPLADQQIMQALSDTSAGVDFLYRHLIGGELPTPGLSEGGSTSVSSTELFKTASDFKTARSASIGFNASEQKEYSRLMRTAIIAEENEKKSKK